MSLCETVMTNSLGINSIHLPQLYQHIRDMSFTRTNKHKVMSTIPPFFFFKNDHLIFIDDITLLRSEESIANCRKALYDMHQIPE